MIFKRKKPPVPSIDTEELDATEDKAHDAMRQLLLQRGRVDEVATAAARELRMNGFTRRFEQALGYPGPAASAGSE